MRSVCSMGHDPIRLINMLKLNGVEAYGSVFILMPTPCSARDRENLVWLRYLWRHGFVRRRMVSTVDQVHELASNTHPHLFDESPICFEVYRLDRRALPRIFARLEREAKVLVA